MATTYQDFSGDYAAGTNYTKTITDFTPYTASEVKVKLTKDDGSIEDLTVTSSNPPTVNGTYYATSSSIIARPSNAGTNLRALRETNLTAEDIEFQAGSSIKAADLNKAQEVLRRGVEETREQKASADNEFTSAEKTKLSGIATGAEVNVQSDWNASSGDAQVLNKPTIPTNNNQLTNGAGFTTNTGTVTSVTGTAPIVSSGGTTPAISISDDSITEVKLDIHNAPSGTDKVLGYTSNGLEWVDNNNTTATNVDSAGAIMNSDLDGKGEILVGDGSGDPTALAVGTNNYVLTADSNEASGVKWASAGSTTIDDDSLGEVKLDIHNAPSNGKVLGYTTNGLEWVSQSGGGGGSGIALTDLSVTSNSAGTAALSYNNSSGVFSYTPPDLSGYSVTSHNHDSSYNNYTHPTTAGNLHIPSGGSSGQFLKYSASGTAVWAADNNTIYTHPNHTGEVTSTGDGATEIVNNIIDEANLKVSNSPVDGYFLQAQSSNTGGLTWAAVSGGGGSGISDIVEDTTPQLGGHLDCNSKHITESVSAIGTAGATGSISNSSATIYTVLTSASTSSTFTLSFLASNFPNGTSALYLVKNAGNKTIAWSNVDWIGGTAPTISTTKYSAIEFVYVSGVSSNVIGCYLGDVG